MEDSLVKKEEITQKLRDMNLLATDIEEIAFQKILESKAKEIGELLPEYLDINRFLRSAMVAYSRNSKLHECTRKSLFFSCVDAAEVGLDFNVVKGWAYLIPYKNKDTGLQEANFMAGYRGLIELMMRPGELEDIDAQIVREQDLFDYELGSHPFVKHKLCFENTSTPIIASYVIATFKSGKQKIEIVPFIELEKIHKKSKAPDSPAWNSFPGEMYRKIGIKRIRKYLRISSERLDLAIEKDNEKFGIDFNGQSDTKSLTEKVDEKLAGAGLAEPKEKSASQKADEKLIEDAGLEISQPEFTGELPL